MPEAHNAPHLFNDRLSDRIGLLGARPQRCINHGRIVEQGQPDRLLHKHFPRALVRVPLQALPDGKTPPSGFEVRDGFALAATNDIDRVLGELDRQSVSLDELHIGTPTLDDLFLKLTGHGLRES